MVKAPVQESEADYKLLFKNMIEGFAYCKMIFDSKGRPQDFVYVEVNDAFAKHTGLKNVVGKRVTQIIPTIKKEHPEILTMYGNVVKTGKPIKTELYFKPLSMWLSLSVYRPKAGYFVAVFENITERKKSEERFHQLADNVKEVFFVMDSNYKETLFINRAYENVWKRSCKSLYKNPLSFLSPVIKKDKQHVIEYIKNIQQGISKGEVEFCIIWPNKEVHWILAHAYPIFDEKGKVYRICGTATDITDRKKNEEILVAKSNDIERFNKAFVNRELKMVELKKKVSKFERRH